MSPNEQSNMLAFLNVKLENIPKFYSAILPKLCGGSKVVDLLFYRPLSYVDRSKSLLNAQVGEFATFMAKVYEHQ
ncbi:ATP-dependent DNA helicase RecG, partial [Wolbachia endosymbiont of Atemnus politus]|nr:ATP-dependent DNA helicase RecG [Wolbachia endosymbiont of Atemnus politus]